MATGNDAIILITGVPGSGKSSLASELAPALRAERLSLDDIKERLFQRAGDVLSRNLLRLSSEAELLSKVREIDGPVVIDIWIAPGRDDVRLKQAFTDLDRQVIELVCRVPADLAITRYAARVRGGPHLPADQAMLDRIRAAADEIGPLGIGPSIDVDTSGQVDLPALVARIEDLG